MSNPYHSTKYQHAKPRNPTLLPTIYNRQLPFSSPIPDDQRSVQSTNTYQTHNPFMSPSPSRTPSVGEESDSTYGQDEFPLERYSQSTNNDRRRYITRDENTKASQAIHGREDSPSRRPRPGLNIITDFSRSDGRSLTDGIVVEQVHASRPQLGHRSVTSVASQKVEHGFETAQKSPPRIGGFINLKDLAKLRQPDKERGKEHAASGDSEKQKPKGFSWRKPGKTDDGLGLRPDPSSNGADLRDSNVSPRRNGRHHNRKASVNGVSPGDRSIVIGISVPQHEAEAHQPAAGDSALTLQTPGTPAIVVTPADGSPNWASTLHPNQTGASRRPVSSVYSQMTTKDKFYFAEQDAPPIPSIRNKDGFILDHGNKAIHPYGARSTGHALSRPESAESFETIFDDDLDPPLGRRPRSGSAESQMQILDSDVDSARPKSNGWWNLMLSPMLSRAGTQKARKSPESPKVPAVPNIYNHSADSNQDREIKIDGNISPQTPRRLGIGVESVDAWPSWTEWERARGKVVTASAENVDSFPTKPLDHQPGLASTSQPFTVEVSAPSKGLAAEYYYACAVDERGGAPYFACENHSCIDNTPALGFIAMEKDNPLSIGQEPTSLANEKQSDRHIRSESDSTVIDDEPHELSPNIRLADAAPILKAKALEKSIEPSQDDHENMNQRHEPPVGSVKQKRTPGPPAYSPGRPAMTKFPNLASVVRAELPEPLASPGPISPGMQKIMAPRGAVPMHIVHTREVVAPVFFTSSTRYPDLPPQTNMAPVTFSDLGKPSEIQEKNESRRQRLEKEDAIAHKAGNLWRGRGCFPKNGCLGRSGPGGRKKRRVYLGIGGVLLAIVITCIVLATQLTRKGDHTPVQSQWLNLTGFPPIPTGISTIAQPDPSTEDSSCVQPSTLWSCAVSKEDQASIAPNDPDQPNFRFEIRFRNGTVPSNETIPQSSISSKRSRIMPQKDLASRQNDPFTNALFAPTPAAPNINEQIFLGNTTDNITQPFQGEETPFFITFVSTTPVLPSAFNGTTSSNTVDRRQSTNSNSLIDAIPPPDIAPDGTAAAANLLPDAPLPFSQPIRLYNRGSQFEHYGFYTYFDRAIFLESQQLLNSTTAFDDVANNPDNQNGGAPKSKAGLRCTWSQTRFLVKIWTSPSFGATLLGTPPASSSSSDSIPNDSATDFTSPGSFPYPVSISLDRHGGSLNKKGAYCYGVDADGHIVVDEKGIVNEQRSSGGIAVNPAPPLVQIQGQDDGFDPNAGGIDGGTGGCSCEWRNWVGVF